MTGRPTRVNRTTFDAGRRGGGGTVAGHFECGPQYRTVRPPREDVLLFVVTGGAGRFRKSGGEVTVSAGCAALYLPGADQDYGTCPSAGRWRFRWCHTTPRPHLWPSLHWPGAWEGLGVVALDDPIVRREAASSLRRAADLMTQPLANAADLAANAAEAALLWCSAANPEGGPAVDPRVRAACDLARRRRDRRASVDAMADAAGLSGPRLNVLFREQLGVSPAAYAENLRLDEAARLLASAGLSVKEAAAACGFHDAAHLSRRFKRRFGRPPTG